MPHRSNPIHFLREAVNSMNSVGAIWPSSPFLAKKIVTLSKVSRANTILELGPGDGIFTKYILKEKSPRARFMALEKNASFVRLLQEEFPSANIIEGCATKLDAFLNEYSIDAVETVVSGLPWSIFPPELQTTILEQIYKALTPTGTFVTFAYFGPHWGAGGRSFRKSLQNRFQHVKTSPIEILNFPPAFVYIVEK